MAAQSPASVEASAAAEYDPKTDPKRRPANSKDPGWEFGYWEDPRDRDKVTCKLCDKKIPGGIKRFKQHLAWGFGDVVNCPKTAANTELRKRMKDYLEKNKRRRALILDDQENNENEEQGEDDEVVEVQVQQEDASGTATTAQSQVSKVPSSGTAAKRRQSALQFKPVAASKTKPNENKKPIVQMFRRTPEEIVDERRSGARFQKTIQNSMKTKEEKHYVDMQWAYFFYEAGISFHASTLRQFEIALEATSQYGSGYVPASEYMFREPLLWEAVQETSKMRVDHERAWKHYGCTLMSDGWTDKRGRHLINFLVNSPEGTYFLESIDASGEVHDQDMLADLLEKKIEEIGKDKVVQVVTDNGANYKAAGRLLMERIPTLFWSPCAAHCLDLMLEEIGNLKPFKKTITRAKRVVNFIYRHGRILCAMREKTNGKDIVRPAATRFATSYLSLKSMYTLRDPLKALFVCDIWTGSKLAKTDAGKKAHDTVLSIEFWNSVEDCLRAAAPLVVVLRAADGDEKPAMPEVAALMTEAKEKIKLGFPTQNKKDLLNDILRIIDKRWVNQMDHPLYGAALYLNPGRLYPLITDDIDETVGQLRACFLKVLRRMVPDRELRRKINDQAMDYECQRGDAFSDEMAIESIDSKSPLDWWRSYGGLAIDLQRFARRVVGLCASSSGCERNWSTFEQIHTKRRNRLLHKRLNAIVFISYNRKMKTRFQMLRQKKKNIDPLVLSHFDWNNEWADSLHVPPQGHRGGPLPDGPSWELVDEAIGASEALRGRNFPRRAHSRKRARMPRNSTRIVEEDDLDEDEEEEQLGTDEEELRDPYDDAEVTDAEGSLPNGGEESRDDANNTNEFDDGY